jgi:hypothetical protein
MRQHYLKTWPAPLEAIKADIKNYEFRPDDRGFEVGDELVLLGWDPSLQLYTGEVVRVTVTYITRHPTLNMQPGYCIMSFRTWHAMERLAPWDIVINTNKCAGCGVNTIPVAEGKLLCSHCVRRTGHQLWYECVPKS